MKILNRQFTRLFEEIKGYEAGIELRGYEVKAIREGKIKLEGSYVKIKDGEAYLINAEVYPYSFSYSETFDSKRKRKLLLTKKEITQIQIQLSSHAALTVIPKSCYNKGRWIKIKIALVKARKEHGKRRLEKKKKITRAQEKEIKEALKVKGG